MLLTPTHRAHPIRASRPSGRAKPGAASDGGGDGARAAPAPTPTIGIARPQAPHVASACFKCFRCFVGMFQMFHADGAKIDQDVAYVAIVVHVCSKRLFPKFHLFF